MARTYTLDPPRQFNRTTPQSGVITVERSEPPEDELNYFRVVGTEMSWTDIDERGKPCGRRTGIVRATAKGISLIECSNGEWFRESAQGIHPLPDSQRCTHCGEFVCSETCHTHQPVIHMNPLKITELAAITAPRTAINGVEGILLDLGPRSQYKSGKKTGQDFQKGKLKDSQGHTVDLWIDAPELIQDPSMKGRAVVIMAKNTANGIAGVYYENGEYNNAPTHTIKLTATAVITYPQAGNAPQTPPAASHPPAATQTPPARQDAPQASSVRNTGHPESTVEERVAAWLRIAEEVCRQISKPFEGFMEGLSSTDIKEITTGISMSYKGQYGVYAPPVFDSQKGDGRMPEDSPAPRASLPSWKDFVNVKSKKKLGDYDDATFLKLACWAYSTQLAPEAAEARLLQANVRLGVVEKKIARNVFLSLFAQAPGYGTEFDEQDLETVAGEQLGKASSNLTLSEWEQSLDQFQAIIADCKTARENGSPEIPF